MQSEREHTLEERYAIKFCFKLGKNACHRNVRNASDYFSTMKWMNRASVFKWHKRFKESRESVRDDERCGRRKEVYRPELIGHGLGLGLLNWGFKGVQEEIPWEEASTLQIGSMAFPPGQCTSPQLDPCHWLFDQDGHRYERWKLRSWKRLWRRSLTCSHKRISMGPSRSCWNGTTRALHLEDITSKGNSFMCVLSIKVPIRKKSWNIFNDPRNCV